jgi:hypothetical protein
MADEDGFQTSLAEPIFLEWKYATELVAAFAEFANAPSCPGPKLRSNVENGFYASTFCGFCDVEIEGWGIAYNHQVDFIVFKKSSYAPYQTDKVKNFFESVVNHRGFSGGAFEQATPGGGHFGTAYADEFDVVTSLL